MISGVSAYFSANSPYVAASARQTKEAAEPFSVPSSALRADAAQPARDPAADSVELGRDFPQFPANQSYAPPPVQPAREPAGGDRATPGLGEELDERAMGGGEGVEDGAGASDGKKPDGAGESDEAEGSDEAGAGEEKKPGGGELDEGEQAQVRELKSRDREVRAHEMAHQAVGGAYAGGASYEFQQGPDGQRYAIGGEVSIDMSAERDPQATIAKMQQVKAAAMAPAQPSGQDRAVAATATEMEARAEASAESSNPEEAGAAEGVADGKEADSPLSGQGLSDAGRNGGGETAEASSNPFVREYRQSRADPYKSAVTAANVLNLSKSRHAVDIVA